MSNEEIETTIHSIAVEICRTDPNIESAVKKLRKKLAPRRDELAEQLYESAVLRAVHIARGYIMRCVKDSTMPSGSRVAAGAADGSAAFDRGFLSSWRTPDGRWLKDVTGADLVTFAAKESEMASGHAKVSRFYAALAAKVGDRKVGEAMSDAEAAKLWTTADTKTKAASQWQ